MLIAGSGDHEKLLSILHPNGQRLIERIKAAGQFTIVLDECHHLLEMWGYLLRALAHELGDNVFLVGLTATPPSEMGAREALLYQELFGRADFEVPTPAVVKEGNLAPYQELAYITSPLEHELAYIAEEKTRFEELLASMMRPDLGTVSVRRLAAQPDLRAQDQGRSRSLLAAIRGRSSRPCACRSSLLLREPDAAA